MNNLSLTTYSFLFILFLLMTALICLGFRNNRKRKFLIKKRIRQISWKKFSKMNLIMFGIFYIVSDNKNFYWYDSILLTISISALVIFHIIININATKDENEYLNSKEFDRECKLNSILKSK